MSSAIPFNHPNSRGEKRKSFIGVSWSSKSSQVKSILFIRPKITPHDVSEGFTIMCQFTGCKYLQTSHKTHKNIYTNQNIYRES